MEIPKYFVYTAGGVAIVSVIVAIVVAFVRL